MKMQFLYLETTKNNAEAAHSYHPWGKIHGLMLPESVLQMGRSLTFDLLRYSAALLHR